MTSTTEASPPGRGLRRFAKRALLIALLVVLLLVWPVGCTTVVTPPGGLVDPVAVYVIDHGHTPSLVLPAPGGGMTRYVYGDWRYYALIQDDTLTGLRALCWPTQGTLGRAAMHGPPHPDVALDQLAIGYETLHSIEVERDAAYRLHRQLEERYHEQHGTAVVNDTYGLTFVHDRRSYTWFYNSNHAVADWLRALDCDVRGPSFVSRWRVDAAEAR